jgi:hypothetical protein
MIRKLLPVTALAVLAQVGLTTPAHASPIYARVNVVIKSGSDSGGKFYSVCADGHAATLVTTGGQWSFQVDVVRGTATTTYQFAQSGVADYVKCSKHYKGSTKTGEVRGLLNYSNVDLDIAGTGANSKPWAELNASVTIQLDGVNDDGLGTGALP